MFLTRNLFIDLSFYTKTTPHTQYEYHFLDNIMKFLSIGTKAETRAYLRAAFSAVGAADELDVATAVLVSPTVPSLESLRKQRHTHKY